MTVVDNGKTTTVPRPVTISAPTTQPFVARPGSSGVSISIQFHEYMINALAKDNEKLMHELEEQFAAAPGTTESEKQLKDIIARQSIIIGDLQHKALLLEDQIRTLEQQKP
jgi:hypothetical protein